MIENFVRFEDDNSIFIETVTEVDEVKIYNPWLLSIFIKKQKNLDIKKIKNRLVESLESNDLSKYVGARLVDDWNEFYFYAYDSKRLDFIVSEIFKKENCIYESNIVRDTKWNFHFLNIAPSKLEICNIESSKTISMLKDEKEDLSIEREVEHYISFLTPTQKNKFIHSLNLDGFTFKDEISSDDFDHGIVLVKTHSVVEDEVRAVVSNIFFEIEKYGGFYEGWSTILIKGNNE